MHNNLLQIVISLFCFDIELIVLSPWSVLINFAIDFNTDITEMVDLPTFFLFWLIARGDQFEALKNIFTEYNVI